MIDFNKILIGDNKIELSKLPDESINCCVTSPPYWGLRDYGVEGQLGLEKTPEEYTVKMVEIFREVKRILKKDGTLWLNLGDSYSGAGWRNNNDNPGKKQITNRGTNISNIKINTGLKPKDLVGIPWRVAFALQADGWWLRQDIIWHKPNPMPESVTDRCTKAHEYIFLLSKSPKYYFDNEAIKEPVAASTPARRLRGVSDKHKNINGAPGQSPHTMNNPRPNHKNLLVDGKQPNSFHIDRVNGFKDKKYDKRNKRTVWTISTKPFKEAHFATFPEDLILPCVLAGCPKNGVVLDPFFGAGTTGVVCKKNNRNYIGIELNPEYCKIAEERLAKINY